MGCCRDDCQCSRRKLPPVYAESLHDAIELSDALGVPVSYRLPELILGESSRLKSNVSVTVGGFRDACPLGGIEDGDEEV